ncbi:hypothetical protein [Micromonospora humi]|uniref:hypothetical protein n=1 Tax=Micromonospora humi TaxID=745366 RepID=UPI0011130281|nr:hypothetical protein [Micromonospora humi]
MTDQQNKLRQTLSRYAVGLAGLVTIVGGAVLAGRDGTLTLDELLSAIGLNLIASVIFAVTFFLLSTRVQEQILLDVVREHNSELRGELVRTMGGHYDRFLPVAVYPPSDEFNPRFNEAISNSLASTNLYAFRGVSAKYVAARLRRSPHTPQQVKIAMLDPRATKAVWRAASDRQRREAPNPVDEELFHRIEDEVLMSIVALFDCRHICPIDIALSAATGTTRIEIFDDFVYGSWYRHPEAEEFNFPETFCFRAGSFFYEYQRLELFRRLEIAEEKISFDSGTPEGELLSTLGSVARREVSTEDVAGWREKYAIYMGSFAEHLRRI